MTAAGEVEPPFVTGVTVVADPAVTVAVLREDRYHLGMVVEIVHLEAKAGMEAQLREALGVARPIIARAPGYVGSVFHQGIEEPRAFLLRIEWTTLEDHLRFRETPLLAEWRRPFFHLLEGQVRMTHYQTIAGP